MTREALPAALLAQLRDVSGPRCLLAFDFDGTLAPLVARPDAASLPVGTHARLALLAARRSCAVLSGRSLADVLPRLAGLPLVAIAGNHGAELLVDGACGDAPVVAPDPGADGTGARIAAWRDRLTHALAGVPGVHVEDKRLSLAVHYREAPAPAEALRLIEAATAGLSGARVFGGHAVVNVVSDDRPHKGDALRQLLALLDADAALYVGDDSTDEDAFALASEPGVHLIGVRIGQPAAACAPTAAAHVLPAQADVDALLDALLALVVP